MAVVISLCVVAPPLSAVDKQQMRTAMYDYFAEEKKAAKIGIFGAAIIGGSAAYLTSQSDLAKGTGYALFGAAAAGLIVGGTVYFRTDTQLAKLDRLLESSPEEFRKHESARMEKVNSQFRILKIVEYSLLGGGAATVIAGVAQKADLTTGVGIGLMLDACLFLLFDYFAEARAHVYAQRISDFNTVGRNAELIQGLQFSYPF